MSSNPLWDNIVFREGEDFSMTWIITDAEGDPIDFSVGGYSFAVMVRHDTADASPALSLTSTPPAGLALGSDGSLTMSVPRADIAAMIVAGWDQKPRGIFSAVMTDPGGATTTEVEGTSLTKRMPTR